MLRIFLLNFLFYLMLPPTAFACECVIGNFEPENLEKNADVIFEGENKTDSELAHSFVITHFDVNKVIKHPQNTNNINRDDIPRAGKQVTILQNYNSCSHVFPPGKFKVYASYVHSSPDTDNSLDAVNTYLTTGHCYGSHSLK